MTIRLATFRLDWGMSLLIAWENNMAWINNYPEDQFASLWNQMLPLAKLPDRDQAFVKQVSEDRDITSLLNEETLILSLLGTCGLESEWRARSEVDRFQSLFNEIKQSSVNFVLTGQIFET